MMPQDFEFELIPKMEFCFNCAFSEECDAKAWISGCDRWNKGPAYRRGTKEYLALLLEAVKFIQANPLPIYDQDGYEYDTNIFIAEVQ